MFSIDIAGIAISVFFIVSILLKKKKRNADLLLLLINLNIITLLAVGAIFQIKLTRWIFFLLNVIPLYLYPLFLIYALEMLQEKIHLRGRWILVFLPALITSAYISADLFLFHHHNQSQLEHLYNSPPLGYHLLCKGFSIVFIIAFIWLLKRLNAYAHNIKGRYSFIEPIALNWLNNSAWIYILVTLISLLGFITAQMQILPISSHLVCNIMGGLLFIAIFYISLQGSGNIRLLNITEGKPRYSIKLIKAYRDRNQRKQTLRLSTKHLH